MNDEELYQLWEERAAIREYDGGTRRARAEYLAAMDIKRIAGRIPDAVLLIVLPDGPVRQMVDCRRKVQ